MVGGVQNNVGPGMVGGYGGGYGYGRGRGFALIVVLFILLIIVGASKLGYKD
nr:YjcZ family sporulation protein [Alteribacillus sp. YIM 98480]